MYGAFNHERSAVDPVELVRPYPRPEDREVAGFIASALAFGNVRAVMQSVSNVLERMGPSPAAFAKAFSPRRDRGAFAAVVHRWIRGDDVVALIWVLRQMLERSGSIEAFFVEGYSPDHDDIGPALDSFSERALALDLRRAYQAASRMPHSASRIPHSASRSRRPGVCYFFPRPSAGSACKRLNLFLRWMIRRDEVDPGGWTRVPRSKLVVYWM